MSRPLQGRTALVTGASRGIGAAIAERLASAGAHVIIHYRMAADAAESIAHRCSQHQVNVITAAADIASKQEIQQLHDKLEKQGMLPDILVNNAGYAHYGMLADLSEHEWDMIMNINLKGMFLCTQAFMQRMVSQQFGRIINVSSVWGISGASCEVAYSAAKGGVNAFTKALAKELAPSGVTVNAVAPGVVETRMVQHLSTEERNALLDDIPVGRFAQPEEVASLVHFLSLPDSAYITGQIISPNGGWQT